MSPLSHNTKRAIIAITLLSAFVHLATLFLAQTSLSQITWQHIPSHSAVEIAGAFIAFFVAYMLLVLQSHQRGTSFNYIIASALCCMGIFDAAHALVNPGKVFIWLHSMATFTGGLIFASILLPDTLRNKLQFPFLVWSSVISLIVVMLSLTMPDSIPIMNNENGFTYFATALNMVGGVALLCAAAKLYLEYMAHKNEDDLLFILHCSMFGLAAVMFHQSQLWDVAWWGWHVLRFLAYAVALWFALKNELTANYELRTNEAQLNKKVGTATQKLTDAEQLLAMQQAQQTAVLKCLNDVIVVYDAEGKIQFCSPSTVKMFGYTPEQLAGQPIYILMSTHSMTQTYAPFTQHSKIAGQVIELLAKHKLHNEFPVEVVISEVSHTTPTLFVALIRDISERKNYQYALTQAKEKAEQANKAKSLFLANTSHEIRTPMNGVYGNLQLLSNQPLEKEAKLCVEHALSATQSLMVIVNDILDFSKIEAGKLALDNAPFNINTLIDKVAEHIRVQTRHKPIEVVIHNELKTTDWVGDVTRIGQILLNIASNAAKFTEKGEIILKVSQPDERQLVFCISDTGIGMNRRTQLKLFTRFEQADSSTTKKFGGSGLGMAISLALTKMMKGSLEVKSQEAVGSSFTLSIPKAKPDNAQATKVSTANESNNRLEGMSILLVEDNKMNQLITTKMLEKHGANIAIAENGLEALDAVSDKFQLILMDIQMPKMDGVQACLEIKKQFPDMPILAFTANVMPEDIKRYQNAGFADHISKPVEQDLLLNTIQKHLVVNA